ncbi:MULTISPECIES: hypothetical protein [Pseudofrankia]|uniref:hypothetical protein n=1 Tax=Pseudofrankia TaxID=2994363 RepID=UPI000234B6AD|nr:MULTISPECIES: hypothetical protein [Pseudofrankia]OHV35963.1 hypothetical protein BCD49_20310 [Pseudofrankia sp. EUN1h]
MKLLSPRHRLRPEKVAKTALRGIERTIASPDARPGLVDGQRDIALAQIDSGTHQRTGPHDVKRAELDAQISRNARRRTAKLAVIRSRREQANRQYDAERSHADDWRLAGLGWRFTSVRTSGWLRVLLLMFLAALDFKVFADAWAYVNRAESGLVHYLLGGGVGLGVFVVGMALAHGLSQVFLDRAQRGLLEDADAGLVHLDEDLRRRLVLARPVLGRVVITGVIFMVLVLLGMLVRMGADLNSADRPAVIMQALIPLVGVAAEFWLTDPLDRPERLAGHRERRLAGPGWLEQLRVNARTREETKIVAIATEGEDAKNVQRATYGHARDLVWVAQTDAGVIDLEPLDVHQSGPHPSAISRPEPWARRHTD